MEIDLGPSLRPRQQLGQEISVINKQKNFQFDTEIFYVRDPLIFYDK